MNYHELVSDISSELGMSKKDVKAVLTSAFASITEKGECRLRGFGTFKTVEKAERTGRNPQTGEAITIPATSKLTFKPTRGK